jgi:DNA ligase-1
MLRPILYKRTSTKAVQTWQIEQERERYRVISGQKDGVKVTSEWTVAKPKNVGRANATTPEAQADLEIRAEYVKKLAQGGYHESESDIDKPTFFEPMLAKKYEDWKTAPADLAQGIVYVQPKLDGIRCIIRADGMWSRQGKPITTCPHVLAAVRHLFDKDDSLVLDGELYSHELKANFNRIVSLVKKQKPTQEEFAEAAAMIEFHAYDLPNAHPFAERFVMLRSYLSMMPSCIQVVETDHYRRQDELDAAYLSYLERGFEGQMIRISAGGYEQKRSKQLLKRKEFLDAEFEIVDLVEGEGNRSGMVGYAKLRLPDGRTFDSNVKGDREFLRQTLANRSSLIGKKATCVYFKPTPDGIPRFPRISVIHETERL